MKLWRVRRALYRGARILGDFAIAFEHYIATITQDGAHLYVTLSGAQFVLSHQGAVVGGTVVHPSQPHAWQLG